MQTETTGEKKIAPSASFQLRIDSESTEWLYSSLATGASVEMFKGPFPDPFTGFTYTAGAEHGHLVIGAVLDVGADFTDRYGTTVGSPEDLGALLKRYSGVQFTPDGRRLGLFRDNQVQGIITRINQDQIMIQRNGGTLNPAGMSPINNLTLQLDQANLLIQRYVSAIWKAEPEMSHRQLNLTLGIPALPEGAASNYFSTFEIVGKGFLVHPRPVDLETDIGGFKRVKQAVEGLIVDYTKPDVSRAFGTQPFSNRIVLLSGPEGMGKSLFAKAMDKRLRTLYPDTFEDFELPIADMLTKYGTATDDVIKTVLDHVTGNERNGVPTFLLFDSLEHLLPPNQRPGSISTEPSASEFSYSLRTLNPIYKVIREFGADIGQNSHHTIVFGESRVPRNYLPDAVSRTFRREFNLGQPTVEDYAQILTVHIRTMRRFAQSTGSDPFSTDIESRLPAIAAFAKGLTGKELRQALDDIATSHKAAFDGENYPQTTEADIERELKLLQSAKGIQEKDVRPLGFSQHVIQ